MTADELWRAAELWVGLGPGRQAVQAGERRVVLSDRRGRRVEVALSGAGVPCSRRAGGAWLEMPLDERHGAEPVASQVARWAQGVFNVAGKGG